MEREQELLQVILEMRELAHFQVALAEHEAELSVDWEAIETKLSTVLLKFGVVEEGS